MKISKCKTLQVANMQKKAMNMAQQAEGQERLLRNVQCRAAHDGSCVNVAQPGLTVGRSSTRGPCNYPVVAQTCDLHTLDVGRVEGSSGSQVSALHCVVYVFDGVLCNISMLVCVCYRIEQSIQPCPVSEKVRSRGEKKSVLSPTRSHRFTFRDKQAGNESTAGENPAQGYREPEKEEKGGQGESTMEIECVVSCRVAVVITRVVFSQDTRRIRGYRTTSRTRIRSWLRFRRRGGE